MVQARLWEGERSATGGWPPAEHEKFVSARTSAMASVGGKVRLCRDRFPPTPTGDTVL
jgi:hypothetical protein